MVSRSRFEVLEGLQSREGASTLRLRRPFSLNKSMLLAACRWRRTGPQCASIRDTRARSRVAINGYRYEELRLDR
jgi:hypothetical protein